MRFYALYAAIFVYALFSSPTPDRVGMAEAAVAAFLMLAVGVAGAPSAFMRRLPSAALSYHRLFLLWMLSVPLIVGVINAHAPGDILRDMVPVIFLILPLCFVADDDPHATEILAKITVLAGVCFALRYLWMAAPVFINLGWEPAHDSMLYLANSPLIPFAAIIGFAWITKTRGWFWAHRIVGVAVFTVCLLAMAAMVQRAPLFLTLAACGVVAFARLGPSPLRTILVLALLTAAAWPLVPLIVQIWDGLVAKTLAVGWNSRLTESAAVRQMIWRGDIIDSLFGYGWGSLWQSPAVAGQWVRFTHNMMTYYWLKAGLAGLILSVVFVVVWLREGLGLLRHNIVIALAILVPLFIHSFFYTGFKTLDYAVLLLLLSLHTKRPWQTNSPSLF